MNASEDGIDIPLLRQGAELLLEYGQLSQQSGDQVLKAMEMLSTDTVTVSRAKGACTRIKMARYRLRGDIPEDDRTTLLRALACAAKNQLPRG